MPYEIQHNTLADGWVNTWLVSDDTGNLHPETFDTANEAEIALAEFLFDLAEEHEAGQIAACNPDDYRIRFVQFTEAQLNDQPEGESP